MPLRKPLDYNQYRGNKITTAALEPVASISDLEDWLKIPSGDESSNLSLMISAATRHIENTLNIAMVTTEYQMVLDNWPMGIEPWWDGVRQAHTNILTTEGRAADIELPISPLQSVDSMTVDGSSITIATYFSVDTVQKYGRLVLKQGATWPVVSDLNANAIVINYTSGFGDTADDVPSDLKMAVLMMAAYMFEHRGDGCSAESAYKESGAKSLAGVYKVGRL